MGYIIKDVEHNCYYEKSIMGVGKHFGFEIDKARNFKTKKQAQEFLEKGFSNLRCFKNLDVIYHKTLKKGK